MVYKFAFEKKSDIIKIKLTNTEETFDPLTVFGDLIKNARTGKINGLIMDSIRIFGVVNQEEIVSNEKVIDYFDVMCDLRKKIETKELSTFRCSGKT